MPSAVEADVWIFDLDNTLYPAECRLFDQIDVRMGAFISELLSVDRVEARRIQKLYFMEYGTTLRGLMDRHGVAPEDFLAYVHDIDVSPVPPNARLARALARLDGRKLVYTNGSAKHAGNVLQRLGVAGHFEGVFDIAGADYVPKPDRRAYDRMVELFAVTPGRAVMIEDMARNLIPAAAMGMTTVWLDAGHEWGAADHDPDSIHHTIDDLTDWLEEQVAG